MGRGPLAVKESGLSEQDSCQGLCSEWTHCSGSHGSPAVWGLSLLWDAGSAVLEFRAPPQPRGLCLHSALLSASLPPTRNSEVVLISVTVANGF